MMTALILAIGLGGLALLIALALRDEFATRRSAGEYLDRPSTPPAGRHV
jgi:hypothetical protein